MQEAETTRRRWERSISQGWSKEIGEADKALVFKDQCSSVFKVNCHL